MAKPKLGKTAKLVAVVATSAFEWSSSGRGHEIFENFVVEAVADDADSDAELLPATDIDASLGVRLKTKRSMAATPWNTELSAVDFASPQTTTALAQFKDWHWFGEDHPGSAKRCIERAKVLAKLGWAELSLWVFDSGPEEGCHSGFTDDGYPKFVGENVVWVQAAGDTRVPWEVIKHPTPKVYTSSAGRHPTEVPQVQLPGWAEPEFHINPIVLKKPRTEQLPEDAGMPRDHTSSALVGEIDFGRSVHTFSLLSWDYIGVIDPKKAMGRRPQSEPAGSKWEAKLHAARMAQLKKLPPSTRITISYEGDVIPPDPLRQRIGRARSARPAA